MEELLEINPPSLLDIGCWAVGSSCWDEGAGYGAAVLDERAPLSAVLDNFNQSGASLFNNATYEIKDHGSAYELGNSELCSEFNKGFHGRRNAGDMVAPYPPSPYPSIPCFPSTSASAFSSSNSVLAPFPANFYRNSSGFSGSFFLENPPCCSSTFNPPLCSNPNLISLQRTEHLESKKWSLNFNFKPFSRAPPLLEKGNSAISITEIICKASMARNRAEEFRKRSAESSPLLATTKKLRSSSTDIEAKKKSKERVANDPQSVAARQRRERVSERLKILQELVPYGSKVDLVTMLEKAINYVKFLQLQLQFLTTDEYWPKHRNVQAPPEKPQEDTKSSQHEHVEDEEPQKESSTT